jgi:hypothetical protein
MIGGGRIYRFVGICGRTIVVVVVVVVATNNVGGIGSGMMRVSTAPAWYENNKCHSGNDGTQHRYRDSQNGQPGMMVAAISGLENVMLLFRWLLLLLLCVVGIEVPNGASRIRTGLFLIRVSRVASLELLGTG